MTGAVHEKSRVVPETLGGYELVLRIGRGGMGVVYLARAHVVEDVYRSVAIKLVYPEQDGAGSNAADLIEEARIAARIRHPNVVAVTEVSHFDDGGLYLVMDYVEGDSLHGLMRAAAARGEVVPPRIVARIVDDALAGLHAVHEHRGARDEVLEVVHRDFSPQNLLVGLDGHTLVSDFGIAKAIDSANNTRTGVVKGTLFYLAPEQALGGVLDRRVDVWAAGVVVWEALTGQRLFRGETDAETLLKVVSGGRVAPPSMFRAGVPAELDDAVLCALAKDPRARCPTASELRRRLASGWNAGDGIAEPHEVAAYVREVAGGALTERRARIDAVLARRADTGSSLAPGPAVLEPRGEVRGSRRRLLYGAMVGAALLSGSVIISIAAASSKQRLAERFVPPVAPSTPLVDAPVASATPASRARSTLSVHANAPVRELHLDGRPLVVAKPALDLDVQIPNEGAVRLRAFSVDGRSSEQLVAADQQEVSFHFETQAPRSRRPANDRLAPYRPSKK